MHYFCILLLVIMSIEFYSCFVFYKGEYFKVEIKIMISAFLIQHCQKKQNLWNFGMLLSSYTEQNHSNDESGSNSIQFQNKRQAYLSCNRTGINTLSQSSLVSHHLLINECTAMVCEQINR
jgi:hypothetical protein